MVICLCIFRESTQNIWGSAITRRTTSNHSGKRTSKKQNQQKNLGCFLWMCLIYFCWSKKSGKFIYLQYLLQKNTFHSMGRTCTTPGAFKISSPTASSVTGDRTTTTTARTTGTVDSTRRSINILLLWVGWTSTTMQRVGHWVVSSKQCFLDSQIAF